MATKSNNIRYSQLKKQICDIYCKAEDLNLTENELDKKVVDDLKNAGFEVYYGEQLIGLKPQKFDFILNPEDHPTDHIDYFDGEVIDRPEKAMSWDLYLDTYKNSDQYSVIVVRKPLATQHANLDEHVIEKAEKGTTIKNKKMKTQKLSQKANYVPNRMINEVEVERNGKVTFVDGANILDGVYVKKGVKYEDGGQMNETFPDVDGQDNMSFMAGGKVKKPKELDLEELYPVRVPKKEPDHKIKLENVEGNITLKVYYTPSKTIIVPTGKGGEMANNPPAVYVDGVKKASVEDIKYTFETMWGESGEKENEEEGRKLYPYDEYDGIEDERGIWERKPDMIVKNPVKDGWSSVKVWHFALSTIVSADDGHGAPPLYIEGVVTDKDELLCYAKGLAGTGEEGDIFDSVTEEKIKVPSTAIRSKDKSYKLLYFKKDGKYYAVNDIEPDRAMEFKRSEIPNDVLKRLDNLEKAKRGTTIKTNKMKIKTIADLVANEEAVKAFLTKKIKENYLKGTTFKTDDYIEGSWEQDDAIFEMEELIGKDVYEYVSEDEADTYMELVNAWRDGIAVKLGGSSRKINAEWDGVSGDKRAKEIIDNLEKAKRGTTIKTKQMAESTTNKRFDKLYKAMGPGERTSKKFSKIYMADGSSFRRRNANQYYPDGVPGGEDYVEKRPNRSDKRTFLEQGGGIGEGMGTYETTLQSEIPMAKRGATVKSYDREADKQFSAMGPGERTSRKFAKINKKDGTSFRRKNANQYYPDGVPGGLDYTENRPNRSDKRLWLEEGGNLGEASLNGGFTYEIGGL